MTDYKDTLNLPTTAFPMKANLAQREPEILQRWETLKLYERLRAQPRKNGRFILHDGPPYANARPHLGTALNKILKDIVAKSKTLSDFYAPYVPGWDCHGLPIELNVEKKIGKISDKISPQAFRQACREYAREQVKLQMEDFQRLGVIGDWQHPYLTMDHRYEADIVRALAKMIANGHLHRGQKPVHWCTACGSALAEAEVEYQDKTSPAIDVAFKVTKGSRHFLNKIFPSVKSFADEVIVPIWTTTPWTLPANEAVAVNPDFEYALVSCDLLGKPAQLIFAKELITAVMERYSIKDYKILAIIEGKSLIWDNLPAEHLQLEHPFFPYAVNIISGGHVTIEAGTGCVHIAPAHGQDDYIIGEKNGLEVTNRVDARGCFFEDIGIEELKGLHVFKANPKIIEMLEEKGLLLQKSEIQHSYPHCWRHKIPLIFLATPQWFVRMDPPKFQTSEDEDKNVSNLRENALQAVDKVEWIPSSGKNRIARMLESRPDWCISRQRSWGVPITLFIDKKTGKRHPRTLELMEAAAKKIEKQGIDAWFTLDAAELLGQDHAQYIKVTDILDVWFESGLSHFCVLAQRPELAVPADLYLEGSDQHRGWFQSSLLTGVAINNSAPFKEVLTHGYVVDGQGRKMSKSLGNVVVPGEIAKVLGADVLRLWVAASDYKLDINYSDEILKRSVDAYRRIRNTMRFLLANISDFDPEKDAVKDEQLLPLDQWVISAVIELQNEIRTAYDQYNFQTIFQKIINFCTVQLGGFYLDIIKDRQYTSFKTGIPRRSAQTAVYHLAEALVRILAPIISFTAEEIWSFLPGKRSESVFLDTWYNKFPKINPNTLNWPLLIKVKDEVNKVLEGWLREGNEARAFAVCLYADDELLNELKILGDELRFILITSEAGIQPLNEASKDALVKQTGMPGLKVKVTVTLDKKCERCWQHRADVGKNEEHPTICGRCITNLTFPGEIRHFA